MGNKVFNVSFIDFYLFYKEDDSKKHLFPNNQNNLNNEIFLCVKR
ncbi:hypothetical protein PCARR_a2304 [Pseudoalteromonas carrageenovora IAM 12662]|uniref:Uncharacterized protein n=1 Tax=Pseudoalteromonas carrageenovora IAM 12662 TaxID=1314868 RepID=A0ABR9EVT2_PSEVC|nr:hypothetical protein [Pseudoalteromonas carrageenovora IAM 12662]